ncbi:MAG TPA: RNA polymerase sigma-70 factor [Gemmatimonadaceae bacterium]|jgi:RNA polymerase sigma-70 factor (ECF subfamily)
MPFLRARRSADDPTPASTHDRDLLRRVYDGDREALDVLLRRYWGPLVAYATRMLDERDAAEDVVQRGFIRLWDRRGTRNLVEVESPRLLLFRIVRNLIFNEWRRRGVRERYLEEGAHELPAAEASPLERLEELELQEAVRRAVEMLPPRRREVFVLSRYHGMEHREIAEVMSISVQTVSNQMSAALSELRLRLATVLADPTNPLPLVPRISPPSAARE